MLPSPSRLRPLDDANAPESSRELRLVHRENRVAVVLNARAKRVSARVYKAFQAIVPPEDLFYSRTLEEAKDHAKAIVEQRYGTVMVGGGDGTVTNTMNLLLRASERAGRAPLRPTLPDIGVLRLGTGNGLAAFAGAGEPKDDVLRAIMGERPAAHPLALVEDASSGWVFPFASVGYDAQILNDYVELCSSSKSGIGQVMTKSLAGYFYALGTRTIPHELRSSRAHVRIVATGRSSIIDPETDEEIPLERGATLFEGTARSISAATSPYYGYAMCIHPFARRRSDRFHLRISTASIPYLLVRLPSLWRGTLRTPQIVDFLTEAVRIESTVPMPLQMAGDACGHATSLELRLSERAFRILEGSRKKALSGGWDAAGVAKRAYISR